MSQKSVLGLDQLHQQTLVAQKSRQHKLRISGSEHFSSPQCHNNSEHLQEDTSSYPEYLAGYSEHTVQNNTENVFPGYNNYMIASDPYNFLGSSDSHPLPAKHTSKFHGESAQETPPLVRNIKAGDSSISVSFNSLANPSRLQSWGSGGPQIEMLNNNALLNIPSSVNITTSIVAPELLATPRRQSSTFGSNGREESTATYFPGSSIETDTMQTLYLMNPGVAGFTHSVASGNMMLINNMAGNVLATHNFVPNGQPHQQFIEIGVPAASPSQHSSLGRIENSAAEQHSVVSSLLTSALGAHGYNSWQGGGNEMTFRQTTDAASSNQSLRGQLNSSTKLDNPSVAEISQLGLKHPPMLSIEERQSDLLTTGLRLQLDQSPTATGQRQELSLRLSPQHLSTVQVPSYQNHHGELDINCPGTAQATSEEDTYGVERANQDGMMGAGFSNSVHSPGVSKGIQSSLNVVVDFLNIRRGSKYLKAVQELLDEVVSLGNFGKHDSVNHHKSQSLFGTRPDRENTATEEDGIADARTIHTTSAEEADNPHNTELTTAGRQELQIKKTKLVAMLDEVNRKYRQYYHQMQIVVSSFESVTEVGAAKTYTSLALQTISRQFRSLRNAITAEIRVASKGLGEEEKSGSRKGETSRFRFMDQQLRQQRALQQLGMIQHVWRPQRGLPEQSVSVLRAWLFEHFLHPYPKDADKVMLARQAGLSRSQVSNWFINARVRLWKPMVEEMYMDETKEAELGHGSAEKHGKKNVENKEEVKADGGPGNSQYRHEQKHKKTAHLDSSIQDVICDEQNTIVSGSLKSEHSSDANDDKNRTFSMEEASDEEVFHEVQDDGATQGLLKKARNGIEDQIYHFASNLGTIIDFKMEESCPADTCDNKFNDGRCNNEDYSLVQNYMLHADVNESPGSYQLGCSNRYEQDSFISRFSGSSGVSLTLGLQQSDGLSFSRTQPTCISSQGKSNELGRATDDNCNIRGAGVVNAANAYDSIGL